MKLLLASAALILAGCSTQSGLSATTATALSTVAVDQTACKGQGVPTGFVVVDAAKEDACPGTGPTNTVHMTSYTEMPVGSQISVCVTQRTPQGWHVVERVREANRCYGAYPPTGGRATVKIIERIS